MDLTRSLNKHQPLLLALLLSFVVSAILLTQWGRPGWVDQLSYWVEDTKQSRLSPPHNESRIVIIDIDEKSLQQEGRWPWPRDRVRQLVDQLLHHYQVALIGLDILFPEGGRTEQERRVRLGGEKVVLAQTFDFSVTKEPLQSGKLGPPVVLKGGQLQQLPTATGYIGNHAAILNQGVAGHIWPALDRDGKLRRIAPLVQYAGESYEMLSITMLQQLLNPRKQSARTIRVNQKTAGMAPAARLEIGGEGTPYTIPLDQQGYTEIPYPPTEGWISYLSAVDILEQRVDPAQIDNRIVLVGSSALGLSDRVQTPAGREIPGVEVHAAILAAILDQRFRATPKSINTLMWGVHLFILLLLTWAAYNSGARGVAWVVPLLGVGWGLVNSQLWKNGLQIPLVEPLLLLAAFTLLYLVLYLNQMEGQWRYMLQQLLSYVPREAVEKMLSQKTAPNELQTEQQRITLLFADLHDFVGIAETQPPEQTTRMIQEILQKMTEIIALHHGIVDKYIGDAVMAYWKEPLTEQQQAHNALEAAIEMQQQLYQTLNPKLQQQGLNRVTMGIGINSGEVSFANMGTEQRRAYTVIGDTVNVASRIQSLTKTYQQPILLGGQTAQLLQPPPLWVDSIQIRGKESAVSLYRPQT